MVSNENVCFVDTYKDMNLDISNYDHIISDTSSFIDSLLDRSVDINISEEDKIILFKYLNKILAVLHQTRNNQVELKNANEERTKAYNKYREKYNALMAQESQKHADFDRIISVLNNAISEDSVGKGFVLLDNKINVIVGVIEELTQSIQLIIQLLQALNSCKNNTDATKNFNDSFSVFSNQLKELHKLHAPINVETINTTVIDGNVSTDRDININK